MNKRSLPSTMACIAAMTLLAATTSMANVLTNAGFETDAVPNAAPVAGATGWTPQGNANTASATNDPTRTGIGSLQLVGPGVFTVPLASQTFAATPGQTLKGSVPSIDTSSKGSGAQPAKTNAETLKR